VVHRETRRYLIERFPYCLYFRLEGDGVIVIALLHASRDPEVHRDRL
jgi:plasmid stabilization system protein ParE